MSNIRFRFIGEGRGRSWVRDHLGESVSNGGQLTVHVTSRDDMTPNHRRSGYDSRCGWCYLGANHSDAAHQAKVSE